MGHGFESPLELALRLPTSDLAPAIARHALLGVRVRLGDDITDDVELLISELVTNSVRHGAQERATHIDVLVSVTRRRVRAEVSDANGFRWDLVTRQLPDEQGGFGFLLLANLASRWGVETGPPTRVWFEIDRPIEVSSGVAPGSHDAAEAQPLTELTGKVHG